MSEPIIRPATLAPRLPPWFGNAMAALALVAGLIGTYVDSMTEASLLREKIMVLETRVRATSDHLAAQDKATRIFYKEEWSRVARLEANQGAILLTLQEIRESIKRIEDDIR